MALVSHRSDDRRSYSLAWPSNPKPPANDLPALRTSLYGLTAREIGSIQYKPRKCSGISKCRSYSCSASIFNSLQGLCPMALSRTPSIKSRDARWTSPCCVLDFRDLDKFVPEALTGANPPLLQPRGNPTP